MKPLPYVYKLTNKNTGHFYIGYRSANTAPSSEDLGHFYFSSSPLVKEKFKEFDRQIIAEFFDGKDAWLFEQSLIEEHCKDPLLLNKSFFKNGSKVFSTSGRPRTEEEKQRIREKKLGIKRDYVPSPETISKMVAARAWYKPTKETLEQMVATRKQNHSEWHSEETGKKISNATQGRIPWNKGKKGGTSWNKGMKGGTPWNKGLKLGPQSIEQREKRSANRIGKHFYNNPVTGETVFCLPEDCPDGWAKGKSTKQK